MSLSIHTMLNLNSKLFELNQYVKFFDRDGKKYAYLNRMPWRISFMEVSEDLAALLQQFDGIKTVNEIIIKNDLNADIFPLFDVLNNYSIVRESGSSYTQPEKNVLSLTFFPTTTCNLRCVYCYASAGDSPSLMLDIDKAEQWIEYSFSHITDAIKTVRVLFHGGGEPTKAFGLIQEIWEKIKTRCIEKNLSYLLTSITNGNYNDAIANWLIRENASVVFSVDGSQKTHDTYRPRADGKGSFDIAYANIKKLKEAGRLISMRSTIGAQNKNSIKDLVDMASECGIKFLHIDKLNPFGRSDDLINKTIDNEEFQHLFFEAWRYALEKNIVLSGYSSMSLNAGRSFFCNDYERTSLSITTEGFLSPCPEVSLKSDSVSDVFFLGQLHEDGTIEFAQDKIDKLKNRKTENIPECSLCFMAAVCNGGCAVKSYRLSDDLLKVDSDKCRHLQNISFKLLTTFLHEPEIIPKILHPKTYEYIDNENKYLYFNHISFDSVR